MRGRDSARTSARRQSPQEAEAVAYSRESPLAQGSGSGTQTAAESPPAGDGRIDGYPFDFADQRFSQPRVPDCLSPLASLVSIPHKASASAPIV